MFEQGDGRNVRVTGAFAKLWGEVLEALCDDCCADTRRKAVEIIMVIRRLVRRDLDFDEIVYLKNVSQITNYSWYQAKLGSLTIFYGVYKDKVFLLDGFFEKYKDRSFMVDRRNNTIDGK